MAMSTSTGSGVNSTPNVTPMIDVMLVLLIIFMIVTPLINSGFQAEPPKGINIASHPEEDGDIVLGIDKDGRYYLDKKRIDNATLGEQLRAIFANREEHVLYLKADQGLKYQKILDAMDIAAHNGVVVVGAITDQVPGTVSTVPGDLPPSMNPNGEKK